ncbi:MAG: GGDEF domain-containing protein [Deltaproteobacteria bacterium]|nr:GGDEF domain-containing protein [Deltaproteobacteria bacterium]
MIDDDDRTVMSDVPGWEEPEAGRLPVLIVLRGAQLGRRYLMNEKRFALGRRENVATLVIPGDPKISSKHCEIEHDAARDCWVVRDAGSTNGTRLNGRMVDLADLAEGDKLLLGDTVLKFSFHDEVESEFHHEVDRLMNIDELTGLVVLRVFRERFHEGFASCSRTRRPLALLMMDLDGLKKINDTHGHQAGALTISGVGYMLGELVGTRGMIARFGGDEFMAAFPGLDSQAAVAAGEQIRAALAAQKFAFGEVLLRPTISIGVAAMPEDATTPERLIRVADEALYRAKAAGRDRVST